MKVTVDPTAHEYVMACVKATDDEVGGIGYVECIEKGSFHIHKFVLLEQTSSQASVNIEDKAYIEEITKAGDADKLDQLRLNWHSHPNMEVYFSNTDDKGIVEYAACGTPWLLSLVFNEKEEVAGRLDIFDSDIIEQISFDSVKYEVPELDNDIAKQAQEDVKRLVKPRFVTNTNKSWNSKDKAKDDDEEEIIILGGVDDDEDYLTPPWLSLNYDDSDNDEEDWKALEEEFGPAIVAAWKAEDERHGRKK